MKVNTEAIPGTLHLVEHTEASDTIVPTPTPSSSPNDPLNWSKKRKYMAMLCVFVYTYGIGVASAAIYSVLTPISEKTGLSLGTLNEGTGYMFLFLGLGNFFWQPIALQYGKRPVYLISMLATGLIMVWPPYTKGNGDWIASKIIQGFFSAPIESLLEVTISDIWFEHERGAWMSFYAIALLTSNYIAPFVAGFIADGQGWEWVVYWCAIFCVACFFFLFFFQEETNYSRATIAADDTISDSTADEESVPSATSPPNEKNMFTVKGNSIDNPDMNVTEVIELPKTFRQKLQLFDFSRPTNHLKTNFVRPLTMFQFPVVLWSGFAYGSSLVWFNVLNATASLIFTTQYNFTATQVGITYLSPIIFTILFSFLAGWSSDFLKVKLAKRYNGRSEAEHRLWVFYIYAIACPAGLILWGVGAANKIHWMGPVIAMGLIGGSGSLGCSVPCNYAIDSYREMSGHSMVVVILIRNVLSFAIGYGITPWVTNTGLKNTFIAACFIALFCIMTVTVMLIWGKQLRNFRKEKYWSYVQEALDKHMSH